MSYILFIIIGFGKKCSLFNLCYKSEQFFLSKRLVNSTEYFQIVNI